MTERAWSGRGWARWSGCLGLLVAACGAQAAVVQVEVQGSQGKPLADAVVFLESREARAALRPAQGVEIAQVAKQFQPQVTVVPVGSSVSFPNKDTVRHHVYSFSQAKTFEIKLYIGNPGNPVVFDRPGIVVLGCNIHDQMAAWVVVVETPYHARSVSNGKVQIEVPPGSYRLRVWHPDLPVGAPALDQALNVASSGAGVQVKLPIAPP